MGYQAEIRAVDNAIEAGADARLSDWDSDSYYSYDTAPGLNLWDRFLIAITPESHAESIVNEIYSTPANTLRSDPKYDVKDLSSPNVYVQAKGAVSDVTSALSGLAGNTALMLGAFLLIGIAVYAAIPALIRR